ncbi:response regulator RamR [Streptomyces avermitilis]|uniref:Two-component system response regulator n=1 Tax=Streptomyces avermitilis (strain ATCC 31267 / DSM 46492 / JCM 5070 / NBRC 14893 / NCIMB 12804 / NRRL 8165 / MA-4680) TaxID=227882 RepID=Q825F8_STRAW|nr:response regulator transcription factor [Streptomyces sp. SID5469]MYT03036.1 DNA-binding response regulator [Streptomyces sp. SID5469]BAC75210.1 putative two-component system response regulator [Streptomyces avermitilis MA-4680 = NBRC 14893]
MGTRSGRVERLTADGELRADVIRVLLVHDACLVRSVLAEWLRREPDLGVYDTTWRGAPGRVRSVRPDVCAVDLDCADSHGVPPLADVCGRGAGSLTAPRLLVLAHANRPGLLKRAAEAGALGYVDKEGSPERLVSGIRRVAEGERFVDDSLGFGFLKAAEMPLTRRELSVLSLAAGGASVAEIAGSLHLSHGTVRNYMSAITRKTGARNRIDAIRISQGEGWV